MKRKNSLDPKETINFKYRFGVPGRKTRQHCHSICTLSDRIIVADYDGCQIYVFDKNGKLITKFNSTYGNQSQLTTMICTLGEKLIVIRPEVKRMEIFNSDYKHLCLIPIEHQVWGLCSTQKGLILATRRNIVLTLDEKGQTVNSFRPYESDDNYYDLLVSICVNSKDEIILSNHSRVRIDIFSRDGVFLRGFGSEGNAPDQFGYPGEICVDEEDNIYIVDHQNDRISVFTSRGIPLQQISVVNPSQICLLGPRLIVTSIGGFISVFSN